MTAASELDERRKALWRKMHRDFKHRDEDGRRWVLMLRNGGTCSVPLDDVTDDELKRYKV